MVWMNKVLKLCKKDDNNISIYIGFYIIICFATDIKLQNNYEFCRHAPDGTRDRAWPVWSCLLLRFLGRVFSLCYKIGCSPRWQTLEWLGFRVLLYKVSLIFHNISFLNLLLYNFIEEETCWSFSLFLLKVYVSYSRKKSAFMIICFTVQYLYMYYQMNKMHIISAFLENSILTRSFMCSFYNLFQSESFLSSDEMYYIINRKIPVFLI